ncbi:MAG: hypothetical protein RIS26_832 [Actinomycetota bacterium]
MTNARRVAFEALKTVSERDAYLNLVLPKLLADADLELSDSGFATELSYGTARMQGFYDWVISLVTNREVDEIDPEALIVLRIGAHQLLTLETPAHAAIYETVELSKRVCKASVSGFVNAAMRRISEKSLSQWQARLDRENLSEEQKLSIKESHPLWVTRSIKLALSSEGAGDELADALVADNGSPKVHLVALPGKNAVDNNALTRGEASPIGFVLNSGDPAKVPGVSTGTMRVQDQGSQLAALTLSRNKPVRPGERWLDLCAGPGGKAALLAAEAAIAGATLTTNEVSEHRAKLVETAIRHSGFKVEQLTGDGRKLRDKKGFDRIMLDAPCTGLGALRRRPESRWRKSAEGLKELSVLQRELMEAAWENLKPGGTLAYVTCSPHPTETTSQIEWFLRSNPDAKLSDATASLLAINPKLNIKKNRKTAQLWPHRNGTDAMFIALVEKQ